MNPNKLIIILVLLAAMVAPAMAATPITPGLGMDEVFFDQVSVLNYVAPSGLAVAGIEIRVPYQSTTTFTINPGTATETHGSIYYTGDLSSSTETIAIGGDVKDFYFPGNVLHPASLHHIGVAFNNSGQRGYYVDTEILTSYFNQIAYVTVVNATPITTFSFTSDQPVNVKVITESYEKAYTDLAPGGFGDIPGYVPGIDSPGGIPGEIVRWLKLGADIAATIYNLSVQSFYWLKFFFWDNLLLTVCLYIAISAAVAFNQSKDIFAAIQKFFKYQKGLFEFVISMWERLINLIATFRGIFRI